MRVSHKTNLITGATTGLLVSIVYGAIEQWFVAVLPWFTKTRHDYIAYHVGYSALFLTFYAVAGVVLGAAFSVVLERFSRSYRGKDVPTRRTMLGALLTLMILMVIGAEFIVPAARLSLRHLAVSLSIFLLGAAVVSSIFIRPLRRFVSPALIFALFLGLNWATQSFGDLHIRGRMIQVIFVFAVGVVILLCGIAGAQIWRQWNREETGLAPLRALVVASALSAVGLALGAVLQAQPIRKNLTTGNTSASQPNVILIVLDTVRADHTSLYGYHRDTTPNLRKFSQQATTYTLATATGDMTLPSHASLFTGLYPIKHGAHASAIENWGSPLSVHFETLAERLAQKGFSTAAIVANTAYVTSKFGFDQGFEYFNQTYPKAAFQESGQSLRTALGAVVKEMFGVSTELYSSAEQVNTLTYSLLDELERKKRPFFLFLNYMDAHYPYVARPPFDRHYPARDNLPSMREYVGIYRRVLTEEKGLSEEERENLIPRYDAGIAYLDFHLGKLLDHLRTRGVFDNSLIIVLADHGEAFGEKGLFGHGGVSVYQDQVAIPFIIKYPNSRVGDVVREPVSQVDVLPTVLDVLHEEMPRGLDGMSLLRLNGLSQRSVFSESYPGHLAFQLNAERCRWIQRAILTGDKKLILSENGRKELFDVRVDPAEQTNLYGHTTPLAKELEKKIIAWQKEQMPAAPKPSRTLDTGSLERLRSLGYIGGK